MSRHRDPDIDAFFGKSLKKRRAEAAPRAEEFKGNPNLALKLIDAWQAVQASMRRMAELKRDAALFEEIKREFFEVGKPAFERFHALQLAASQEDARMFWEAIGWGSREPPKAQ